MSEIVKFTRGTCVGLGLDGNNDGYEASSALFANWE